MGSERSRGRIGRGSANFSLSRAIPPPPPPPPPLVQPLPSKKCPAATPTPRTLLTNAASAPQQPPSSPAHPLPPCAAPLAAPCRATPAASPPPPAARGAVPAPRPRRGVRMPPCSTAGSVTPPARPVLVPQAAPARMPKARAGTAGPAQSEARARGATRRRGRNQAGPVLKGRRPSPPPFHHGHIRGIAYPSPCLALPWERCRAVSNSRCSACCIPP